MPLWSGMFDDSKTFMLTVKLFILRVHLAKYHLVRFEV